MSTTVELSPAAQRFLLDMAHQRMAGKIASTTRKRDDSWSDVALMYLGLLGEYTASTVLGVPIDTNTYGAHGDGGIDLRVDGVPCAIKTRHVRNGHHVIERISDLAAVSYVLFVRGPCASGDRNCTCRRMDTSQTQIWTFSGWLPTGEFLRLAQKGDWGFGPRWWVDQPHLYTKPLRCSTCGSVGCIAPGVLD